MPVLLAPTLERTPVRARTRASRQKPQTKRNSQLDFVRGIAILAVMEYHFATVPTQNPAARAFESVGKRMGWMGVDLFFVLSGFLVGGLIFGELLRSHQLDVRRFLVRRAFKIWPAYYAYLLFQVVLHRHPRSTFLWQNALNVQNYAGTSLNHTWSLAVEEHFYLLLPPLLLVLYRDLRTRRHIPFILMALCGAVLAGRVVSVYVLHRGNPQWFTHARVDGLLFGVLLSWLFSVRRDLFDQALRSKAILIAIAAAGLLFAFRQGNATRLMGSVGFTTNYLALSALLLLVYGYGGRLTRTRPYRFVAWIGLYSYGIYLWHLSVREPLTRVVAHLPVSLRWSSLLMGQYAAAIVLGVLTTEAIEFPMLRLRDRLFPRGPAQLVAQHS